MSIPVIYANTQYIAGKHLFKTIPEGISTTLTSLTDVPTCNVMTLVGANVGIGTTNPLNSLHVQNQSYFVGNVGIGTTASREYLDIEGGNAIISGNVGIGTTNPIQKLYVVGQIYATDNITAFSDSRFKTNVKKIENVMDKIKQINGYTFNRIDSDKSYMGVIAQEVQQVFPQIIESQGDTLSVAYGNLVAPLIEVVKELNKRIEVLESKLKDL
jgi:hypothetical protein